MASAFEKIYCSKLNDFLESSLKKGGIKSYIQSTFPEYSHPIQLGKLLNREAFMKSKTREVQELRDIRKLRKKSSSTRQSPDYTNTFDISKIMSERIKHPSCVNEQFDPPDISNVTLFNKPIEERFKHNILLNKYSWNRKKALVDRDNSNTVKSVRQDIQKKLKVKKLIESSEKVIKEFANMSNPSYNRKSTLLKAVEDSTALDFKKAELKKKKSIILQNYQTDKENENLRKEFLDDFYIANVLSKKNLTVPQKAIIDGIIKKFDGRNGKYKNLNKYYLNKVKSSDLDPLKEDISRSLQKQRKVYKELISDKPVRKLSIFKSNAG